MTGDVASGEDAGKPPSPRQALGRHGVQFYENDTVLCETVGSYVGSGLGAGEKVIVIATEAHRQEIAARLAGNGIDVERVCSSGRLTLLDARATLAKFMGGVMPDANAFREVMGGLLERGDTPLRAYGEMVDLLWRDGNPRAAIRVEELWNQLAKEQPFSLLCAYVMANFDGEGERDAFEEVCGVHSYVLPAETHVGLEGADARMREIGFLQKRARELEDEIQRRKHLETALRDALVEREELLVEVEADRIRVSESEERQFVQRARLELLQAITASFARALKPRDIAEVIVRQATTVLGAPRGAIWLLTDRANALELVRSIGFTSEEIDRHSRLALDSHRPIAECHRSRSEIWLESRAEYAAAYPEAATEEVDSLEIALLCLPLRVEDRCFGAVSMAFAQARPFTTDERRFLVTLAHHAAQALDRARLFEEAERVHASLRFLSEASSVLAQWRFRGWPTGHPSTCFDPTERFGAWRSHMWTPRKSRSAGSSRAGSRPHRAIRPGPPAWFERETPRSSRTSRKRYSPKP
jgi:hypothetical protein